MKGDNMDIIMLFQDLSLSCTASVADVIVYSLDPLASQTRLSRPSVRILEQELYLCLLSASPSSPSPSSA